MLIGDSIIPWAAEWLAHYELWKWSGQWYGDGGPARAETTTVPTPPVDSSAINRTTRPGPGRPEAVRAAMRASHLQFRAFVAGQSALVCGPPETLSGSASLSEDQSTCRGGHPDAVSITESERLRASHPILSLPNICRSVNDLRTPPLNADRPVLWAPGDSELMPGEVLVDMTTKASAAVPSQGCGQSPFCCSRGCCEAEDGEEQVVVVFGFADGGGDVLVAGLADESHEQVTECGECAG